MRREYFEVISLSTAGLDAHFWDLNAYQQVSQALEQPVTTAQQYVHQQPVNYVDETGWPEGDKQKTT